MIGSGMQSELPPAQGVSWEATVEATSLEGTQWAGPLLQQAERPLETGS
jgi:hypothetical protein